MSRDDDTKDKRADEEERALDLQITEYLKYGVPAATIACAIAAGYMSGPASVVLVLAAGTLIAGIAIFWASVRTLVGETPLTGADAYALGAPRAEEEQKRAVLRALKDLEFERSVGKISEEDYQILVAKYRAEAKRLLRALEDESRPERDLAESLVAERLRAEGLLDGKDEPDAKADDDEDEEEEKPAAKPAPAKAKPAPAKNGKPAKVACAKCGTKNDPDARFCKKCGAKQAAAVDDDDEDDEDDEDDVAEESEKEASS
jgi:ribosomal protein L40E